MVSTPAEVGERPLLTSGSSQKNAGILEIPAESFDFPNNQSLERTAPSAGVLNTGSCSLAAKTLGLHPSDRRSESCQLHQPQQTRIIPLSRGQIALIYEDKYELVRGYAWFAMPRTKSKGRQFYAAAKVGRKTIYMHRLVKDAGPGEEVDHLDPSATLDNRDDNLTLCSHAQNMERRRPGRKPKVAKSGFIGVIQIKGGRYAARATRLQKQIYLGTRDSAADAALLYDAHAIKTYGKWAVLNFQFVPVEARP